MITTKLSAALLGVLAGVSTAQAQHSGAIVSGAGLCLQASDYAEVLECDGNAGQQWTIQGKRGEIRSSAGLCLDAHGAHGDARGGEGDVGLSECDGGRSQHWVFAGTSLKSGGGLCLSADEYDAGSAQVWECASMEGQKWDFKQSVHFESPALSPPTASAPQGKKGALPHLSSIPPTQPTAMDGLWELNIMSLPFKIEAGRVYSMSDYMHLLIFPVETYDVVVKDVVQVGPGRLAGYDMALTGPWTAQLQPNGEMRVRVEGLLGPFEGVLKPIAPDDPNWFAQEIAALSQDGPPPPHLPGPPASFPPDGEDDEISYPPGWGN